MHTLFEAMRAEIPNPIDQLAQQKLLVRMRFNNPTADILVNGRRTPVTIQFGSPKPASGMRADFETEMSADTLHFILLDHLSLKSAIASQKVKVVGALWKTGSLGDILNCGRLLYPEIARLHGLA